MTIEEALGTSTLPSVEKELLLAAALHKERTWMLGHPEQDLTQREEESWKTFINRRDADEPVAYITGKKEFYGRSFIVNPSVLIPRPSTEGLIDLTLEFLKQPLNAVREIDSGIVALSIQLREFTEIKTIVDIGTGSGCIAITLALERPKSNVIATDVDDHALQVAKMNAERYSVGERIIFRSGDALEPVKDLKEPFLVVSNPPYIPEGRALQKEVATFEPKRALFSGDRGLDVLLKILSQAKNHEYCAGCIFECESEQVAELLK